MEKISLYRKYRPSNFANLVGQDIVKITLINAFKNNHVSQAYLFSGPRGTGKTSTARLVAKALNCVNLKDNYEPCDKCEFCSDISEGRLIDIIEIDAASNRGINEVRDLKEKINYAPSRSKHKVYIIDEVHMMTNDAFNALLKTLEEPPSHAYFILATTEFHKIPETIVSRCQSFEFKRITPDIIADRLHYISKNENIMAEKGAIDAIAKYADGGLRDAIGLLDQLKSGGQITLTRVQELLGFSDSSVLHRLYELLIQTNTSQAIALLQDLYIRGCDLKQFTHDFVEVLRIKMLGAINQNDNSTLPRILEMVEIFQFAQRNLNSSIPQLPLEIAVVKATKGSVPLSTPVNPEEKSTASLNKKIVLPSFVPASKSSPVQPSQEPNTTLDPEKSSDVSSISTSERDHQQLDKQPDGLKKDLPIVDLTIDYIKHSWPRIVERIKTPFLRMSLKNALPVELNDKLLVIQFGTRFHQGKVMQKECLFELEAVIKDILNTDLKIDSIVKEVEIKPLEDVHYEDNDYIPYDDPIPPPLSDKPEVATPQPPAKDDMLDKALDIFGGKVV